MQYEPSFTAQTCLAANILPQHQPESKSLCQQWLRQQQQQQQQLQQQQQQQQQGRAGLSQSGGAAEMQQYI